MSDDYRNVFGLDANCTDEELDAAYEQLKKKYSEDRFLEGEAGNEAAKKLTELETAYREIKAERNENGSTAESAGGYFGEVETAIKSGQLSKAQEILDSFNERGAEWHYLQSVVFYKKNWINESKKQLEIAIDMDPDNGKYKNSYEKLTAQIDSNANKNFTDYSGNAAPGADGGKYEDYGESRQMGGDGCLEFCCQMALCNALLNCCCSCR